MKNRILIAGQANIVRAKLRSILSRTNAVEVMEEFTAQGYSAHLEADIVIFIDYMPAETCLKWPVSSAVKTISIKKYTGSPENCRLSAECDLEIYYDDIYGFSGYETMEGLYQPETAAEKNGKTVFPLLIDDIAFWLSQNLKGKSGRYYMCGPDAVLYEKYLTVLAGSGSVRAEILPEPVPEEKDGLRVLKARHSFNRGLEIVSYQKKCSVNIIYKLSEAAAVNGKSVYDMRYALGGLLAGRVKETGKLDFDFVCPIPNTGIPYAKGLAKAGGYSYCELLKKVSNIRSFHIEDMEERRMLLERIVRADGCELKGKKICLVDEAVFTGMTLKVICSLLREKGVGEITAVIPTPPCRKSCAHCSIPVKPMLLEHADASDTARLTGADRVIFQSQKVFEGYLKETGMLCMECFL